MLIFIRFVARFVSYSKKFISTERVASRRTYRRVLCFEPLEPRLLMAVGDLRIVSYNVLANDGSPSNDLGTVLAAIGSESYSGRARPIDVLAVQEVRSQTTATTAIVNQLNAIYGVNAYSRGSLNGAALGGAADTVGLVYRTSTISLINEVAIGNVSTSGQPRQSLRYQLRPLELGAGNDFYLYNSHYKASSGDAEEARRNVEATAIRNNANALGQGALIVYTGDWNLYSSNEAAYQTLLGSGAGQAFDPINRPGNWHNSSSFNDIFTQAPSTNPQAGFVGGGIDDRFDFQLLTGEWFDGVGLEYAPNSYHVFGNNGSVRINNSINNAMSTALAGLTNRSTILNLLTTVTDHLPVVADYLFSSTNRAPVNVLLSATTVMENQPINTNVGTLSTADPDSGDTFTYALVGGTGANDNASFNIVGNVLRTSAAFNFEAKSTYTIRVRTTDQGSSSFDRIFNISVVDVNEAPTVQAVVFGDGMVQRSLVRSITVDFNSVVSLANGSFELTRRNVSTGAFDPIAASQLTIQTSLATFNSGTQSRVSLTFSGSEVIGGSLADGNYQLRIVAANVTTGGQALDGNSDGTSGDDFVRGSAAADNFFRLLGDVNGNRFVNLVELSAARRTLNLSQGDANYNALFDENGNNFVNVIEVNKVRGRLNKLLPF